MRVPKEPDRDAITEHLIKIYHFASRGRRFIAGLAGAIPIPISVREISDWLEAHPSPLSREVIDTALFAIDAVALERD